LEELNIIIRYHALISMPHQEIHTILAGNGATKMKKEFSKFRANSDDRNRPIKLT